MRKKWTVGTIAGLIIFSFFFFWDNPNDQDNLFQRLLNPTPIQMESMLRRGLHLRSAYAISPRQTIGRDIDAEIYMLTWQPRESFVRRAQLEKRVDTSDIPQPIFINSDEPLVYIFNSHPHEMIASTLADLHIGELNVVEMSHELAIKFEEQGIPSLVEDRDVRDVLRANGWNFGASYQASRIFIEERIHQYPSLQFFFDIHRDGIPHDLARIDIDGRPYARILFVIGANNPVGYRENYEMAIRLHYMLEEVRPGISRGVRLHSGAYQNGVYNQDLASTLQLIEIGTYGTTVEEHNNAMVILADVLSRYILKHINE